MTLDEMRKARGKGAVAFLKFNLDCFHNKDCLFCFFEGEDSKYYNSRITEHTNISYDKILCYNCGGRNEVIKAFSLISKADANTNVKKAFFVDKDWDPISIVDPQIYQTPCYSIENFYTSISAFKRIIHQEFTINTIEEDFTRCVADYESILNQFLEETLVLNAWLFCHREKERESGERLIHLSDFKVTKLFEHIGIDSITTKNIINQDTIQKIFCKYHEISPERINEVISNFRSQDMQQVFRGKFVLDFLKKIITDLKEKNKNGGYLIQKRPCVYIEPEINTLSILSKYADTPDCLVEFLNQYKDAS